MAAQHADLMLKVESYNLLHDSNKLLREEKEQLQATLTENQAKLRKHEEKLRPLQQEIRDLQAQRDSLAVDKKSALAEMDRWRARYTHLIGHSHKTDSEEHRRLMEEIQTITHQLEERTKDGVEKFKTINQLKKIGRKYKEQSEQLTQQLEESKAKQEEDEKITRQLKKIGRKYMEQTDLLTKQLEECKAKQKEDEKTAQQVIDRLDAEVLKMSEEINKAKEEAVKLIKLKEEVTKHNKVKESLTKVQEEKAEVEKKLAKTTSLLAIAKTELKTMKDMNVKLTTETLELTKYLSSSEQTSNGAMETPTEKAQEDETKSDTGATDTQSELERGSEAIEQPSCDPCGNEGTNIPAEGYCETCGDYLCNQCFSFHCKPKPMRHHVLLNLQDMPNSDSSTEQHENYQENCIHHVEMPLKVYCRTHNDLGCVLCLTSEHKECRDVSFIQDVAKDTSQSKEYIRFQQELKTLETNFNTQLDTAKSEVEAINEIHTAVKTSNVIKDITTVLDESMNINAIIDEARESAVHLVEEVSSICKDSIAELHQHMNDPKSDILRFINMKQGQAVVFKMNRCLEKLNTDINLFKVGLEQLKSGIRLSKEQISECNMHIQKCLSTTECVSALKTPEKEDTPFISEDVSAQITPEKEDTSFTNIEVISCHCCKVLAHDDNNDSHYSDEENLDCRITGSAILSDGRVALADFCNKMVKVYSSCSNRIEASLDFSSSPFDLTEVINGRIAVTVPSSRTIFMLSVYKLSLKCDNSMKTDGACHGICSDNIVLYVSFDNPPKVEILDLQGQVLKMIVKDGNNQKLFSSPWYIAFNPVNNRIYVTDREKDSVTCMTTDGKVVASHKERDLIRPYGIAADTSGVVYVCARRTDKIVCFTPNLKRMDIIDDMGSYLHKPESVACWNKRDRLYVGLYRDDEMSVLDIQKS